MEDDKPFGCSAPGCGMRFTNEDHLMVHRKKHELLLALNAESSSSAKSAYPSLFVDQTPTPTRFIRNCEEVGLFQDLQNVNPFEEHFRKAVEASKSGTQPSLELNVSSDHDILHTPSVLPSDLENEPCNHNTKVITKLSSPNSSPVAADDDVGGVDHVHCKLESADENEVKDICIHSTMLVADKAFKLSETLAVNPTEKPAISLSPTSSPDESSSVTYQPVESEAQTAEPPVDSTSFVPLPSFTHQPVETTAPETQPAPSMTCTNVVQLILRFPDGRSVPVALPAVPIEQSDSSQLAISTSVPQAQSTYPSVISQAPNVTANKNTTAYFARMKLRQALTQGSTDRPGKQEATLKLMDEIPVSSPTDILGIESTSNDSDSLQPQFNTSKRRRGADGDDPDEKRRRFLERNRAAATRCRLKRKHWVQSLESKADELAAVNQQLQNEVAMLRNEVAHLKSMLLAHKDCPVTLQQQKNMCHINGVPTDSTTKTVIVTNSGDPVESIDLDTAEAIASSALANLGRNNEVAAPAVTVAPAPVVMRTTRILTREQAVALLTMNRGAIQQNAAKVMPEVTVSAAEEEEQCVVIVEDDSNQTLMEVNRNV